MGNEVGLIGNRQCKLLFDFWKFPSPMGNEVGLMKCLSKPSENILEFPSPMGNEVGLIQTRTSILYSKMKFPSPMGNEVGLMLSELQFEKFKARVSVPYGE